MGQILSGAIAGAIAGAIVGLLIGLIMLIVRLAMPAKPCPNCHAPLPKVRMPKNVAEWFWGGMTCPKCKCSLDRKGRRIDNR